MYSTLEAANVINESYHSTETKIWKCVYVQNFGWG